MRKVSVLGCGWLGLPLAERLVQLGYEVKGSTTSEKRLDLLAGAGIEPYLIDLKQLPDNIQRFLESPIVIINIPFKKPAGHRRLLAQIEASAVENVLFVSSTSVYPNVDRTITEEDGLESPDNPWAIIEKLWLGSRSFETTVVRFGGLIGYSRDPARFFPSGRRIAAPESRVNMIHRDDCIAIIERLMEREVWGETFNCCAGTHPTKREFYAHAAAGAGLEPPVFNEADNSSYKIISSEKLKRRLDYKFAYPDLMKIPRG